MYRIFDIALDSDILFPELAEVDAAEAFIRIRAGKDANSIPKQPIWLHHWKTPKGETHISYSKLYDSYLLRFPGLIDFVVSQSGNSLRYFPKAGIPVETIRQLILDQMIPRILGQKGQLVLHAASVILSEGQAIAFLGPSGSGKSTLSSSFLQNGAKRITDDCMMLKTRGEHIIAIPNYYGVRLFDDSATALFGDQPTRSPATHQKKLHLPRNIQPEPEIDHKLNAIFLLADADKNAAQETIMIHQIKGADELMTIIEQTILLDTSELSLAARQFNNMGKLISSGVKLYRLEYPRNYSMLPQIRSRIEDLL